MTESEDYRERNVYIPDDVLTTILRNHIGDKFIDGTALKIEDVESEDLRKEYLKKAPMYCWIHSADHYVACQILYIDESNANVRVYDSLHRRADLYDSAVEVLVKLLGVGCLYTYIRTTVQEEVECGICAINTILDLAGICVTYSRRSAYRRMKYLSP